MVEDTTHRIEAEEALQKSEKRYRSIVENINDGFCIHDFKGVIQDCNENFALMLGFGREELIGTNLDEFSSTRMLSFKNDVVDELKKIRELLNLMVMSVEKKWHPTLLQH